MYELWSATAHPVFVPSLKKGTPSATLATIEESSFHSGLIIVSESELDCGFWDTVLRNYLQQLFTATSNCNLRAIHTLNLGNSNNLEVGLVCCCWPARAHNVMQQT
jgi:hypothetical protein